MTRVLITGSPQTARTTLAAFAASEVEPHLVEPGQAIDAKEPFTHYVQMPVSISLQQGEGLAVARFSEFIQAGLLTRSQLIQEALPHLAEDAVVLLVTGNAPESEQAADLPDDPGARRSLLHVLADALRQDRPGLQVEVLDRSLGSKQIAEKALTGKLGTTPGDPATQEVEDWRIQMAGLVGSDF